MRAAAAAAAAAGKSGRGRGAAAGGQSNGERSDPTAPLGSAAGPQAAGKESAAEDERQRRTDVLDGGGLSGLGDVAGGRQRRLLSGLRVPLLLSL